LLVISGKGSTTLTTFRLSTPPKSTLNLRGSQASLWLELEDHAEFLGDSIPEDLPLLPLYRAGRMVQTTVIEEMDAHSLELRDVPKPDIKPTLWTVFWTLNWAGS
jgi:hypothetical protein